MICIEYVDDDRYINSWYNLFIHSSRDRFNNYFNNFNDDKEIIVTNYLQSFLNNNFKLINVTYNNENVGVINFNENTKYFGYFFTDKYKGLYLGRKAVILFLTSNIKEHETFYAQMFKSNIFSIKLIQNLSQYFHVNKIDENNETYTYKISSIN